MPISPTAPSGAARWIHDQVSPEGFTRFHRDDLARVDWTTDRGMRGVWPLRHRDVRTSGDAAYLRETPVRVGTSFDQALEAAHQLSVRALHNGFGLEPQSPDPVAVLHDPTDGSFYVGRTDESGDLTPISGLDVKRGDHLDTFATVTSRNADLRAIVDGRDVLRFTAAGDVATTPTTHVEHVPNLFERLAGAGRR